MSEFVAKKKSPQYIATKNAKFNGLNEKFLKNFYPLNIYTLRTGENERFFEKS